MTSGLVLRCCLNVPWAPGTKAFDLSNPVLRILGRAHGIHQAWALCFFWVWAWAWARARAGSGGAPGITIGKQCSGQGSCRMQHKPFISTSPISLSVKPTTQDGARYSLPVEVLCAAMGGRVPSGCVVLDPASLPSLPQLSCRSPLEVQQTYWPVCMQDPTLGPPGDATQPCRSLHTPTLSHLRGILCHAVSPVRVGMEPFSPACPSMCGVRAEWKECVL